MTRNYPGTADNGRGNIGPPYFLSKEEIIRKVTRGYIKYIVYVVSITTTRNRSARITDNF